MESKTYSNKLLTLSIQILGVSKQCKCRPISLTEEKSYFVETYFYFG
jgi:hypothetical protein